MSADRTVLEHLVKAVRALQTSDQIDVRRAAAVRERWLEAELAKSAPARLAGGAVRRGKGARNS